MLEQPKFPLAGLLALFALFGDVLALVGLGAPFSTKLEIGAAEIVCALLIVGFHLGRRRERVAVGRRVRQLERENAELRESTRRRQNSDIRRFQRRGVA